MIKTPKAIHKAVSIYSGKWVFGQVIEIEGLTYIHNPDTQLVDVMRKLVEVYPKTVCTYTGEDDVDGHMIFTNDIVDYWRNDQATVRGGCGGFMLDGRIQCTSMLDVEASMKIVGNKYDNYVQGLKK